jgi:hypothetical protein
MSRAFADLRRSTARVDHIPILWVTLTSQAHPHRLVIWLNGRSGSKEQMLPYLQDLAAAGFVALSFDAWEHGERGMEAAQDLATRVFSNFRRAMWPILGQPRSTRYGRLTGPWPSSMWSPRSIFRCAADDSHVPPDGALRFQAALRQRLPSAGNRIRVNLIPEAGHMDTSQPVFWQNCLAWFTGADG